MERKRIVVAMGTRPEAIKLAPVVRALREHGDEFETLVIATAQHRQMLDQVFDIFDIVPEFDLNVMRPNQSLGNLTASVLESMGPVLRDLHPDLLMVQGDTTTVLGASLTAFYERIPVAHVEAGLRSWDLYNPFPEEANRRLTGALVNIHFAPTRLSAQNLLREGVAREKIVVTGNTVVDALTQLLDVPFDLESSPLAGIPFEGHRVLALTSHRRESWGDDLRNICLAVNELLDRIPDLLVVYPVHMNPNVRETVMKMLGNRDRIHLTEPLDYLTFINLMRRAHLILTDSGGVQEEAPSLGKPLLVLRKLTERPEAFRAGLAKVVGTRKEDILEEALKLLTDPEAYQSMTRAQNPYGDGRAAARIVETLRNWSKSVSPLLKNEQEFSAMDKT
jgi:UDP-N-acetylglucosamine 2-epimerase (non-hydrolysing)